jgi:hypothetical protein
MTDQTSPDYSDEEALRQLTRLADAIGVDLDEVEQSGFEANVVGIRTEHVLISRRLDSRTYFIHDSRFGIDRELGFSTASDREHFDRCREILDQLGIEASEIASEALVTEQTQVAFVDHGRQTVELENVREGKRFARIGRRAGAAPVWSSGLVLGMTTEHRIGYLQLHWPELSSHTVHEAHRLAHHVERGWNPPEQPGASIESVEAGVVHSPAIGLLMDVYPAIRVVYAPSDPRYGQKPVAYLDRHGNAVPVPRIADLSAEPLQQRASVSAEGH